MAMAKLGKALVLVMALAAPVMGQTAKQHHENESATQDSKPQSPIRYWEIPLEGTFGVEIQASGVEDAIEKAIRQELQYVIFRINSDGGYVETAQRIAEIMQRHDDQLDYIAVVERGMSASIWVIFSCDYIFVSDDAALGGAVVYTTDRTTGDVSVDAKMNSAHAAVVAAAATAKGHSPVIVRAMMLPEAAAYAWKDSVGVAQIASERPTVENDAEVVTLDTKATVLTLTGNEAVEIGLGRPFDGDIDGIGASLGFSRWRKKSNYGRIAMERAYEAYRTSKAADQRLRNELQRRPALIRYINANTKDAVAADPDNFVYYYDVDPKTGTTYFTRDSWDRWYANTDAGIAAWQRVFSALRTLAKLEDAADRLGVERTSDAVDLEDHGRRAAREIDRLRGNRARGPRL